LLARELVGSLSSEQRAVVEALAARRTPVTSPRVSDLLAGDRETADVRMSMAMVPLEPGASSFAGDIGPPGRTRSPVPRRATMAPGLREWQARQ